MGIFVLFLNSWHFSDHFGAVKIDIRQNVLKISFFSSFSIFLVLFGIVLVFSLIILNSWRLSGIFGGVKTVFGQL